MRSAQDSSLRGPKKILLNRNPIMRNDAPIRPHNDRPPRRRTDERTRIIDEQLERMKSESKMVIRILLDNVSNDPVLKDVLRTFGVPLPNEDQLLYRILLQSKLLLETKQLCRQLEKQNLVQELATDFQSSSTMEYKHNDEMEKEDDDFEDDSTGAAETMIAMTPRDAYDMLISVFPNAQHQTMLPTDTATLLVTDSSTPFQGASQSASRNSRLVIQYADQLRILWLSRTVQNFFMFQRVNPRWNSGIKQYTKEDVFRMTMPTFCPEPKDLSGVSLPFPVITRLRINGADFEIHDIGGMSSRQRLRHAHQFDHADVFLFAASLAQYDEAVPGRALFWPSQQERRETNRLAAAINEFRFFLNRSTPFSQRQPIVMLTQKDLFATKMQYNSLAEQFPFTDFRGTPLQGIEYIVQKFEDIPLKNRAIVQVLPASNQCNVSFFVDSLRQSLMSEEETLQSTESY